MFSLKQKILDIKCPIIAFESTVISVQSSIKMPYKYTKGLIHREMQTKIETLYDT